MKKITVTEFRTLLGKYLAKVISGNSYTITERGKPIAQIVPTRDIPLKRPGNVNRKAQLPADFWDLPRPKDPEGLALRYLITERDER